MVVAGCRGRARSLGKQGLRKRDLSDRVGRFAGPASHKERCDGAGVDFKAHGCYLAAMALVDDLLSLVRDDPAPARDVRVCLRATAVRSRRLGLAYTFPRDPHAHGHGDDPAPRPLRGRPARELADFLLSPEPERASVGLAALNSLLDPPRRLEDAHALEVIVRLGGGRAIALVGHFPFVDRLRPLTRVLWVLELNPHEGDLPAHEAERVLPAADLVVITASTLVNRTLPVLLALARGKPVVLLGPSAPLTPVLLDHGVSAVCGSVVVDPETALRDVSEGVSFRRMRGLRRVVLQSGAASHPA